MAHLAACYYLATFLALAFLTVTAQLYEGRNSVTALQSYQDHHLPNVHRREPPAAELELLDTVLLASIDGRFHALNRTTGRMIWSMDKPVLNPAVSVSRLDELVRTQHQGLRTSLDLPYDPDADDEDLPAETYIIEPQSGHIFVNPLDSKRDEPLQRLPFSMAQLVDMSPFRFDDHRTFVGKKRTSLITLDLASGEVMEILDPEQCSWGDQPTGRRRNLSKFLTKEEELLDELEPPEPERTLIHIGRTDYHVSVFSHGRIIQNLTFSSYGPNNMDKEMQYLWRQTPDNRYHQSSPDGTLLMFKTDEREPFRSFIKLKQPVVAVFDTVSVTDRSSPLILLQPTPPLNDLYPSRLKELRELGKTAELTFVGRIGNSLFALSHHTFPHVIFSQFPSHLTITSESNSDDVDHEYGVALQEVCSSLDCLVGVHRTEDATSSSLSRLIAASVPRPSTILQAPVPMPEVPDDEHDPAASSSSPPVRMSTPRASTVPSWPAIDPPAAAGVWSIGDNLKNPLLTGILGLVVLLWVSVKWMAEQWKQKQSIQTVEKDLGPAAVVAPQLPAVISEPPAPILAETKPLPPVPVDAPVTEPSGDLEKSPDEQPEGDDDDAETEKEGPANGGKKKGPKRRKRGKGGSKKVVVLDVPKEEESEGQAPDSSITIMQSRPATTAPASSLIVSETILGYGSHGTVVFQGSFQGRAVAVKRLLQDFVTLAAREVNILQESDDHPNVIRYYFKENKDNFLYIALELCPASLADIIERPNAFPEISPTFKPKAALAQVTNGLKHLHSLKIVHRDIKPQNILISKPGSNASRETPYRMLISDFGLCRKLELDQTSFLPTLHNGAGGMAAGTVGWRAPEILRGEVKLDDSTLDMSSGGTPNSSVGGTSNGVPGGVTRLTKSVDVFALGCLYYYTLTNGEHPYGERFEREVNIVKNVKKLERLDGLGEEGTEAEDLIGKMLDPDPKARPDTTSCLVHPFFWSPARRLGFLQDASDRFEIMQREPREPQLEALETGAPDVVGNDWHKRLDKVFDENLGKFRKYDGKSVQDLLRALRNKKHHYQDLPDNVKRSLGPLPEGFLAYFTKRFPRLFLHVYSIVAEDPLLRHDAIFRSYFDLSADH